MTDAKGGLQTFAAPCTNGSFAQAAADHPGILAHGTALEAHLSKSWSIFGRNSRSVPNATVHAKQVSKLL
jgi:hypothetical protein